MRHPLKDQVLARFAGAPARTKAHVRARLASVPWPALLECLPKSGLIASLGCGHGAIEIAAALDSPSRQFVACDIDEAKLTQARSAQGSLPIQFCSGDLWPALAARSTRAEAVMAIDVLYLFNPDAQVRFVRDAWQHLPPGGRLLIKEMAATPRWKWGWNRLQEWLACHVLRITASVEGVVGLRPASWWAEVFAREGFAEVRIQPLDAGYFHPHALVTGVKP
jgi:SAM-dependent methyltransferase